MWGRGRWRCRCTSRPTAGESRDCRTASGCQLRTQWLLLGCHGLSPAALHRELTVAARLTGEGLAQELLHPGFPQKPTVPCLLRCRLRWTKTLLSRLAQRGQKLTVRVQGPYADPPVAIGQPDGVILVAGEAVGCTGKAALLLLACASMVDSPCIIECLQLYGTGHLPAALTAPSWPHLLNTHHALPAPSGVHPMPPPQVATALRLRCLCLRSSQPLACPPRACLPCWCGPAARAMSLSLWLHRCWQQPRHWASASQCSCTSQVRIRMCMAAVAAHSFFVSGCAVEDTQYKYVPSGRAAEDTR